MSGGGDDKDSGDEGRRQKGEAQSGGLGNADWDGNFWRRIGGTPASRRR